MHAIRSAVSAIATPTMRMLMTASLVLVGTLLGGCGDEPVPPERKVVYQGGQAQAIERTWLEINSATKPAEWVLEWRTKQRRDKSDAALQAVQRNLTAAHDLYRESERMIANRAVQLEQMLAELNVRESAANILQDMSSIASEVGQTEGFGAVSQHYYILRTSGHDRSSALALLKQRYGVREPSGKL